MRKDVYVQNDSGGMSVLSPSVLERVIDDGRENDGAFVRAHEAILGSLVGDDSFIARVVVGEPLAPDEEGDWIAHYRWALKVPDGKLLVCGGFDPDVLGDWLDAGEHDGVQAVEVPPGHYLVDVYTYLHSMNGRMILADVWEEKLGVWFRRDHPRRPFPSWVAGELSSFHDHDPGHEKEWADLAESVASGTLDVETDPLDWVGFLVHLQPFDASAELTEPEEGDWFGAGQGLRRPERLPLGVPSREARDPEYREALEALIGKSEVERDQEEERSAVNAVDVFSVVGWHDPEPIAGGPVETSPRLLPRLFRLAWFASRSAHPEVLAEGPGVPERASLFEGQEGVATQVDDTSLRVGFNGPGAPFYVLDLLAGIAPETWSTFPSGTLLELATCAPGRGDSGAGEMRFRGPIGGEGDNAVWEVREAHPPVSAETLREALALSRDAEGQDGAVLPLRSAEEARAVLDAYVKEWGILLHSNKPRAEAAAIRFEKLERSEMHMLAAEVFRQRYAEVWPPEPLLGDDDDDNDEGDGEGLGEE